MKSMIVSKNLGFGDGLTTGLTIDSVGDLTDGAITLSRSDTDAILLAGGAGDAVFSSAFANTTMLQFIQRTSDGVILSPRINPRTMTWKKVTYAAKVAKVVYVGRNSSTGTWTLPTPSSNVGGYAQIRIVDKSVHESVNTHQRVVQHLITLADDAGSIHNALFAKLEQYKGIYYANVEKVVSTTNYGYKFTGIAGKDFTVIPELLLSGSAITVSTPTGFGRNATSDLIIMEKRAAVERGYNDPAFGNVAIDPNFPLFIASGTNYDVFNIQWTMNQEYAFSPGFEPFIQDLVIAAPTGQTIVTQIEKVLLACADQTALWAPAN
ncbi:hypothetical protein DSECCO2_120160 [anaerobic digester metagenome]